MSLKGSLIQTLLRPTPNNWRGSSRILDFVSIKFFVFPGQLALLCFVERFLPHVVAQVFKNMAQLLKIYDFTWHPPFIRSCSRYSMWWRCILCLWFVLVNSATILHVFELKFSRDEMQASLFSDLSFAGHDSSDASCCNFQLAGVGWEKSRVAHRELCFRSVGYEDAWFMQAWVFWELGWVHWTQMSSRANVRHHQRHVHNVW